MYSGTGVCAGQAHWQSTTLWKYAGLAMLVGCKNPPGLHGPFHGPLPVYAARAQAASRWIPLREAARAVDEAQERAPGIEMRTGRPPRVSHFAANTSP